MATILIGADARRCDATCHNADGPDCRCICGGRYHGKREAARSLVVADAQGGLISAGSDVSLADVQTALPLEGVERVEVERKPRRKPAQKRQETPQGALNLEGV